MDYGRARGPAEVLLLFCVTRSARDCRWSSGDPFIYQRVTGRPDLGGSLKRQCSREKKKSNKNNDDDEDL